MYPDHAICGGLTLYFIVFYFFFLLLCCFGPFLGNPQKLCIDDSSTFVCYSNKYVLYNSVPHWRNFRQLLSKI